MLSKWAGASCTRRLQRNLAQDRVGAVVSFADAYGERRSGKLRDDHDLITLGKHRSDLADAEPIRAV